MTIKPIIKSIAVLLVGIMMLDTSANSVGFDQMSYSPTGGQVEVTVVYDFADFDIVGGGLNVVYDANAIEFVSYVRGPFAADVQATASPAGSLAAAGFYEGFGIGTFVIFTGISGAGSIGTFTFNVLGATNTGATACGQTLCLVENNLNPFENLAGTPVGPEMLAAGITAANVTSIPVPAAVWFMFSGLGVLLGIGRKSW